MADGRRGPAPRSARDRVRCSGSDIAVAPARAVAELADTVTPQGLVAVCHMVDVPAGQALSASARLVVLCDQVRDPGNLGTVIRCADAFGADAVLISRDSVDLYNAKTVRATTGSLFHLPIAIGADLGRGGRAGPRLQACRCSAPMPQQPARSMTSPQSGELAQTHACG